MVAICDWIVRICDGLPSLSAPAYSAVMALGQAACRRTCAWGRYVLVSADVIQHDISGHSTCFLALSGIDGREYSYTERAHCVWLIYIRCTHWQRCNGWR